MNDGYDFYGKCCDGKLVERIISGDKNAAYFLIEVRYRNELNGVIGAKLSKYMKFTDDDLEYWLEKFHDNMIDPKILVKNSKFENIKDIDKVKNWLCRCCSIFLRHGINKISIPKNIDYNFDFIQNSDTYNDAEAKSGDDRQEFLKLWIIDFFVEHLSKCDLYIMLTYMYENTEIAHVVHLDDKIANALNQYHCRGKCFSGDEVRKIRTRSIDKAKAKFGKEKNEITILLSTI
jgi:hypothetical protein